MSILNTSVSGMQANSNWLSTISQNVANSNTTGYKNVETDFSSLVDQIANGDADFGGVSTRAGLAQRAAGQRHLHVDGDRPRRPGLWVLRRFRLQRHDLSDAQRLLHARRLGQPRQQRRLLPDGGERAKRRFAARGELADRSREGQCRQRRADRDGDHRRLADRQSAVDRDARRAGQSAVDQFGKLDLYRCDLACRLRQSRRLAHDQSLFHQHRAQHLGGRRVRCVGRFRQRRLSLFVRSARDADPDLQSDDRRAVLRLAALVHGPERPDDEPRSEQHDAACGGLQRDCGDRERKCARAESAASPFRPVDP